MPDSYPRQQARTRRFSLGAPRDFRVGAGGTRVAYLRSPAGDDPQTALWVCDVDAGRERLVAAPDALAGDEAAEESAEERARRERRRERAGGIVAYGADAAVSRAVFVLAGQAWLADLAGPGRPERLELAAGPVFDARLDPTGRYVAWCAGGDLWVADADAGRCGATARRLAGDDTPEVTWGQAEFVAAEEMHRDRGYWWAPDGSGLLAARVDTAPVATWWVADPVNPERPPVAHRYPAAGTADAEVTLWYLGLDGTRRQVGWDRDTYPYLPVVTWPAGASPLAVVERRDHGAALVVEIDVATGRTAGVAEASDEAWVDWPLGVPSRLAGGALVWADHADDTRRLTVDGVAVTPAGLQVRAVHHVGSSVLFTASGEPTEVELWRWSPAGLERLTSGGVVVAAAGGGSTVVVARRRLEQPGVDARILAGSTAATFAGSTVATFAGSTVATFAGSTVATLASTTEVPTVEPRVVIESLGERRLRAAVLLPDGHSAGAPLPVLALPYGGPGAQKVLADRHAWLEAQWWADQGFAVVVADGRGTPGRGPAWERAVHLDLATAALDDQVDALRAAAAAHPEVDLGRVGIAGWSFGGYLAALAVLRRPDVFHAAVAGAPVTEWRLYDTYYTERFLGHPGEDPAPYDRSSLLGDAAGLTRPLLVVHGLVDDNVVVAHTLLLSQRLTEAGRPHSVLPLSGVTHMASAEEVAEHLLTLQLGFLRDALG